MYDNAFDTAGHAPAPRVRSKNRHEKTLELVEGGLVCLLAAVKAGDPQREIIWRIEEELRHARRPSP
jgi:hypothetical protein